METTLQKPSADRALFILLRKLEEAKARNPQISLRAFSQKIGLSSGALSEILAGRRPLSLATKKKIAPQLMLSPQEEFDFFQVGLPGHMEQVGDERLTLSQDQFHLISDWWYFGLLNLLKTRGFKNNLAWIAHRLGLKTQLVKESLDRLTRMGFVSLEKGKLVRKVAHVHTGDAMLDLSVRRSHIEDLKLIEKSLLEVPSELRDNYSTTFVINRKDLSKAQEMIRVFQSQFLQKISSDHGDEVYKISIALYPLTQVTGDQ